MEKMNQYGLPEMFKPFLWSYRFEDVNPEQYKKEIIVNGLNYGRLQHWRWLVNHYGKSVIRDLLTQIQVTELSPRVHVLASILFNIDEKEFKSSPRGSYSFG